MKTHHESTNYDELDRNDAIEPDADMYSRRSPLYRAIVQWWEACGVGTFMARGYADDRLVPDAHGGAVPWDGTPDQQQRLRTRRRPVPVEMSASAVTVRASERTPTSDLPDMDPDAEREPKAENHADALERARVRLQDSTVRHRALVHFWQSHQGMGPTKAHLLARDDSLPFEEGVAKWDGSDWQVGLLLKYAYLPAPAVASTPAPEPTATPRQTEPKASAVSTPALVTAPSRPGPAHGWDRLPKAVTRDRQLSAQAVRLYALLLDVSDNRSKVASVDQTSLANWMGFKKGGRDRVRVLLAELEGRGHIERVLRGRRLGKEGVASRYRVRCGSVPLRPEDDVRGKGLK